MIQAPVQEESASEVGVSTDPSLVVLFLAQTDAKCTSCGYNLRGCRQMCCPECGEEIRLSLRNSSTPSLQKALGYVVWGMLVQVGLSFLWTMWIMLIYSRMRMPAGTSMGAGWYVRWGMQAAADVAIGTVCVVLLRKLRMLAAGRGRPETIARLCLTLGILVAAMMVLVVVLGMLN